MPRPSALSLTTLVAVLCFVAGCSHLPASGPGRSDVRDAAARPGTQAVQIVDVNDAVARKLLAQRRQQQFSETLGQVRHTDPTIGAGDALEINLWEAPPATLFGGGMTDVRGLPSTSRATTMPEQVVDREGFIRIPFAGRVKAAGLTPQMLEAEIMRRLTGKANQPEALVRVLRNSSANVTVVGEVATSLRMPLTASGERLLDALAAAGGVRQPVNKTTVQVTRGDSFHSMPLDRVIRDPRQNVPLRAGDVVTAIFQPLSFTALGATGKNEEISFEAQGINLAQALARAGGLIDARSDAQGVFIFRLEQPGALDWPRQPVATTPDGLVPVVYRVDLKDPGSFFMMQSFAMSDKDVLFVSNAPVTELQKFLNTVFSAVYPLITVINAVN
ncbi:MAG: polysaccharide export protein [Burkholderiaceae bacterium]|nr:polysaccharide export protein [Burkholderiaceae bacterium]